MTFVPNPEIIHGHVAVYFMALQTKEYWQDAVSCLQTFMQDKVFGPRQVVHLHLHVHDAMFHSINMQGAESKASNVSSSRIRSSLIGLGVRRIHRKTLVLFVTSSPCKVIFCLLFYLPLRTVFNRIFWSLSKFGFCSLWLRSRFWSR